MPPPATPSGYPTHTHHKRAESTLGAAALPCMQPLAPSCCTLSCVLQRRAPEEGRREWLGGAARALHACYGPGYAAHMMYVQRACVRSMMKHMRMRYMWAICRLLARRSSMRSTPQSRGCSPPERDLEAALLAAEPAQLTCATYACIGIGYVRCVWAVQPWYAHGLLMTCVT